jgi:hypothetical protein
VSAAAYRRGSRLLSSEADKRMPAWVRAMKGGLRLRFPLMTRDEIRAEISAGAATAG